MEKYTVVRMRKLPKKANGRSYCADSLVGMYINEHLYSDVNPVAKIVGVKSQTIVYVQAVKAGENKTEMEFTPGGFSRHCLNNSAQRYDFTLDEQVEEMRLTNTVLKDKMYVISDKPKKYYDYNF